MTLLFMRNVFLVSIWLVGLLATPTVAQKAGQRKAPAAPSQATQAAFDTLAQQAETARTADKLDEAATLYLKALKLQPTWKEGWWAFGTVLYEQDRYDEARTAFRNLIALDQQFGPAFTLLGLCEFQLKDYAQALLHLRRGNEAGGGNEELQRVARYQEALLHVRFEQFEMALDVALRYLLQKEPTAEMIELLGLATLRLPYLPSETPVAKRELVVKAGRAAFYASGDAAARAKQEYQELLAQFPTAPGVHYAYGSFLLRSDSEAGLASLRRELEISPNHVMARLLIAFEYLKRNEPAAGLPFAEQAARLAPGLFAVHNALGRLLLETGQVARAITSLEQGVKLAPTSPEMLFALARAYAKAGRTKDAERTRAAFARLEALRNAQQQQKNNEALQGAKP